MRLRRSAPSRPPSQRSRSLPPAAATARRAERRQAARRHDGRADHEHRRQHRRRPRADHRHRPGGHELAHVRAEAERRRAAVDDRRPLRQRPEARGADEGARRAEHQGRRRHRRARDEVDPAERVRLRLLVPEVRRQAQPAPLDRPGVRGALRARSSATTSPSATRPTPPYYSANFDRFQAKVDAFDRGDADVVRDDPARQAQAADLPRRLRVLRPRLRLGRHRRDPGVGLRGPDAEGGRGAHRPGQGDEGAGDLRLRGLPEPRARADRQGGGREVRRRPARRRPARQARRPRALLDGAHALRLRDDDRGDGRRRVRAEGLQARRTWHPTRRRTRNDRGASRLSRSTASPAATRRGRPRRRRPHGRPKASSSASSGRRAAARRRCCARSPAASAPSAAA